MWEAALEKLKVLDYEIGYCANKGKKPFNRIHFVFPIANVSHQFDDFVSISEWLFSEITADPGFFKRDQYDDPNTVANKMMLALRQVDFRLSFPAQKLRQASGENVCAVIEFLTDKALEAKKFKWKTPVYLDNDEVRILPRATALLLCCGVVLFCGI
jgi:intraflagellar transport protein 57